MSDHDMPDHGYALDEGLRAAAERVLDWVDQQQPWNPSGDFDALYAATGRRRPMGEEPIGPRYYFYGAPPALSSQPAPDAELDVERLARALNESVGTLGWLHLTPPNAVDEWRENARIIAIEYARLALPQPGEPT